MSLIRRKSLSSQPPFSFLVRGVFTSTQASVWPLLQHNSQAAQKLSPIHPPASWTASSHPFIAARSLCNPEKSLNLNIVICKKGDRGRASLQDCWGTSNWNTYEVVAKTDLEVVRREKIDKELLFLFMVLTGSFPSHLRKEAKIASNIKI